MAKKKKGVWSAPGELWVLCGQLIVEVKPSIVEQSGNFLFHLTVSEHLS